MAADVDNPYDCNFDPDFTYQDPCAWHWAADGDPGKPVAADAGGEDGYVADADARIEGGGTPAQRWRTCYGGYRSFCDERWRLTARPA